MRKASLSRATSETSIEIELNLDGSGQYNISTGIRFFDHMLELFSKHSLIDLSVKADGDIDIDNHHTVEDVGITLGKVLLEALGDKKSIKRYGSLILPMDEALVMTALDISGRSYLAFDAPMPRERVGDFETECVKEFLYAFAMNAGICLHVKMLSGENAHHIIECIFKSLAKAMREAVTLDPKIQGVPSTKGLL